MYRDACQLGLSLSSLGPSFFLLYPSIHPSIWLVSVVHHSTHTQQSRAKANSNQSIRTRLMTRWMMMPRLYQSDLHIGLSLVSVSTTLARPFLIHPPTLLQTETHFGSDRVNRTKKNGRWAQPCVKDRRIFFFLFRVFASPAVLTLGPSAISLPDPSQFFIIIFPSFLSSSRQLVTFFPLFLLLSI